MTCCLRKWTLNLFARNSFHKIFSAGVILRRSSRARSCFSFVTFWPGLMFLTGITWFYYCFIWNRKRYIAKIEKIWYIVHHVSVVLTYYKPLSRLPKWGEAQTSSNKDYSWKPNTPSPQKRIHHHALFHLEEGQTDTPINLLHLGVGPNPTHLPSPPMGRG